MTTDENGFLARWSKRKQQAARAPAPDQAVESPAGTPMPSVSGEEEPVRLEDLPPIDSIDAETDLSGWLRRDVPPEWRQAALRKLWVADPGIRDFVGLADYAWDFNTPGAIPGFGPLGPADDLRALLAQATGGTPDKVAESGRQSEVAHNLCGETPHSSKADHAGKEGDSVAMQQNGDDQPGQGKPVETTETSVRLSLSADANWPTETVDEPLSAAVQQSSYRPKLQEPRQPILRRRGGGAMPD